MLCQITALLPTSASRCCLRSGLPCLQAFDSVKERTSVIPFAAIADGRQQLPANFYKEFLRLPYLTILLLTLGAYWAHPLMQAGSHWLGW